MSTTSSASGSLTLLDGFERPSPGSSYPDDILPLTNMVRLKKRAKAIVKDGGGLSGRTTPSNRGSGRTTPTGSEASSSFSPADLAKLEDLELIERIMRLRNRGIHAPSRNGVRILKTTGTTMDDDDPDAPHSNNCSSYIINAAAGTVTRPLFLSPPGTIESVACSVQTMAIETAEVGIQCQRGKAWNARRAEDGRSFYLCEATGESRWGVTGMEGWMIGEDPWSGGVFYEHADTGEVRLDLWPSGTCWEEMKDEATGKSYWYSNLSKASQWEAPLWVDKVDQETGKTFFYSPSTGQTRWQRPSDFIPRVVITNEGQSPSSSSVIPTPAAALPAGAVLPAAAAASTATTNCSAPPYLPITNDSNNNHPLPTSSTSTDTSSSTTTCTSPPSFRSVQKPKGRLNLNLNLNSNLNDEQQQEEGEGGEGRRRGITVVSIRAQLLGWVVAVCVVILSLLMQWSVAREAGGGGRYDYAAGDRRREEWMMMKGGMGGNEGKEAERGGERGFKEGGIMNALHATATSGAAAADTPSLHPPRSAKNHHPLAQAPFGPHLKPEEIEVLVNRQLRGRTSSVEGLRATILALVEEWRKLIATRKVIARLKAAHSAFVHHAATAKERALASFNWEWAPVG